MPTSDAFALKNSGLNEFLFAEVGTEANGSPLTILSVLARLGQDPWAEAARWTKLPPASMIDRLANCISQMPLRPQFLAEARATAARLILLLPPKTDPLRIVPGTAGGNSWGLPLLPIAVFLVVLAFGIGFQMITSTAPPTVSSQVVESPSAQRNQ
jgi:hypothetical protein